jgi:anti-sigma regulatory factor (Ser/Thr protein kinase)
MVNICVFDDNPDQAQIIADWLDKPVIHEYEVLNRHIAETDVLLADAHSFLRYRLHYPVPQCPVAWMTTTPIESLLRLAIAHGVNTILPKQLPLNITFWQRTLEGCAHGQLPLDALMASGARHESWLIQNSTDILDGFHRLRAFFGDNGARDLDDLSTVYMEAATNSVYHAIKTPEGHDYYEKGCFIEALPPAFWVQVTVWQDAEKAGIQVRDNGGTVKMVDALYWLDRHTRGAGQLDVHGRGFFLMRVLTDGVALNVQPQQHAELLAWQYHHPSAHPNKPLLFMQST